MKRVLLATAALVAAVAVFTLISLPARRIALDVPWDDGTVAGAMHIHTIRSDGSGTPDEIAAAAARAGLKFVIFTDHGDATRTPDPPAYLSGVLCLDAVEISTNGGHVIALDLPAAPYPLAGEARDVIEDVHRLGGFAIAAHPDSPKAELAWSDWTVPVDGVEILNPDTGWRMQFTGEGAAGKWRLLQALFTYPWRPSATLAHLLTRSTEAENRWIALTETRRVVGLAGDDAHAKVSVREADPGDNRLSVAVPSYESSLRTLAVHVRPADPLSGEALLDAPRILAAIRAGHVHAVVDAWAGPPAFSFTAANQAGTAEEGDQLRAVGSLSLKVRSNAPPDFVTTVWRDKASLAEDQPGRELTFTGDDTAASYRVEIRRRNQPNAPAWIVSNPIYVGPRAAAAVMPNASAVASHRVSLFDQKTEIGWTHENDATSLVALEIVPQGNQASAVRIRYGLSGGDDRGQFAGAAVDTPSGVANYDRVAFTVRGEGPMRVSIQARAQVEGKPPERWQRSIYIDDMDRKRFVTFSDMTPVGKTSTRQVPYGAVRSIMFIVDTMNSKPGASGRVWLKDIRLEKLRE